jgi:4-amino-4-deoxy-L-arabinose transferase-like glycosyltransferase
MEGGLPRTSGSRGGVALALLLLGAVVLLTYRLGAKDLWDASEARPPQSAREMRLHGDWLVQYTNGEVDLTKPPLQAWLVAASFAAFGESETAARLPTVLATLGVLTVVFVLGRRAAGTRAGVLAGFLCLTQARFLWQARLAELEMLLTLAVTLSYAALPLALEAQGGHRFRRALAHFAALGFAFAVKGPIAVLLVVPGSIAYALTAKRGRAMASGAFLAAIPAFVLVGFAWYVAISLRDRAYLDTLISFAKGENVGHLNPAWYYLWEWPLNALPWTPLVVLGLVAVLRRGLRSEPDARRRAVLLPAAAFATTFVALSCLHAKQTHYLIPVFPMAAVLAGAWLDDAIARATPAFLRCVRAYSAVIAGAAGGGLAWFVARPLIPSTWALAAVAAAVATPFAAMAWTQAARRPGATALTCAAWIVAICLAGVGHVAPAQNPRQSPRAFFGRVAAEVPVPGALAWSVFASHSDYLWYLSERLEGVRGVPEIVGKDEAETVARVRAWLATPEPRWAIVTETQAVDLGAGAISRIRDSRVGKKDRAFALVSNAGAGRGRR